ESPAPLRWTGWAVLAAEQIATAPSDADEESLRGWLVGLGDAGHSCLEVAAPLSVQSFQEILQSHNAILAKKFPGLLMGGRESDPGVWLSRNVSLHPTARIVPPVFIGENSRIGAQVELGPDAVIGRDCVLDTGCKVMNSVLFPGGYVGQSLRLVDVLV